MAQKYTFYSFIVFFLRKMNKILLIYHTYRLIVCKNVTTTTLLGAVGIVCLLQDKTRREREDANRQ